MRSLLGEFRSLDNVLDHFLLLPPLLIVAPPHRSLVLAFKSKVSASLASGFSFIALLSS